MENLIAWYKLTFAVCLREAYLASYKRAWRKERERERERGGGGGVGEGQFKTGAAIIGSLFCFMRGITEKLKHFLKISAWRDFSSTLRGGSRKIRKGRTSGNVSAIITYY